MTRISWSEYQRIKDLKVLDLEFCDYGHVNILNLGWGVWGKWYCLKHEREHVLCPKLCLLASRNALGCELVRKRSKRTEEPAKPNRPYDWANCYLCFKELKGAGKTGKIKNRNSPSFWGVSSSYKILCLECLGRKYYSRLVDWQRKKFREYIRRGYI
ncbi:MAG: hypothetical protein MRERV_7c011 [Mycoplasmataceae bacterium RV_VA103A]|nr:MAG: hypothetical protein MRERV_7c011 [Mycoplasmataceae bacterium RV_VA103A]